MRASTGDVMDDRALKERHRAERDAFHRVSLMGKMVPLLIETMMDNPGTLWGDACYPVVK